MFVAMACINFLVAGALFTCVAIDWSRERTLNAKCAFWSLANIAVALMALYIA